MTDYTALALAATFTSGYALGRNNLSHIFTILLLAALFSAAFRRWFHLTIALNRKTHFVTKKILNKESESGIDRDSRFKMIQSLMDPQLTPAENSLKLLKYVLSECLAADLSEELRSCLLYCVEVLEMKCDDLCVPQALLETDALESFGINDADSSVQEWLLSQFTRARSSISLGHSMVVRDASAAERRASGEKVDFGFQALDSSLECARKDNESSEISEGLIAGSDSSRKVDDCHDVPQSFGFGVLFSGQMSMCMERSNAKLPFESTSAEEEDIFESLRGIDRLDWDIFALREASNGRELQVLGWHILREWEMDRKFGIEEVVLQEWLKFVDLSYASCEYHNATHAADVLQTVHFMLTAGGARRFLGDLEVLALLLAAMIHDVGHDGYTNSFHKHRLTDRALLYNDQSIQENFHVWMVFNHMSDRPEINIFRSLSASEFAELRRMLILLVLSTDMSKHFSLLQEVRSLVELHGQDPAAWSESVGPLMCFLLHACDIAGQAKTQRLALVWATRIFAEFFHQGDVERELGLPTSPLCDRGSTVISSAEIGFIKFIMQPTFELVAQLLPAAGEVCLRELDKNLAYWQLREDSNARLRADPPEGVRRRATMNEARRTAGRFSPLASPRRNVLQVTSSKWHRSSVV